MDQPLSYVQFDDWTLDFKELAEWFGMELSRIIVDHAFSLSVSNERNSGEI
jgi:hypothetical protein